jgi:hypothetical protein
MTIDYYRKIFEYVFDSSLTEIGKAISLARDDYQIYWSFYFFHWIRYAGLTFHYFGDPQMNIYTETPKVLTPLHQKWIAWDGRAPYECFDVVVYFNDAKTAVPHALVCLSYDSLLYKLGYADESGTISFSYLDDLPDSCTGMAKLVVSAPNCFTYESDIQVIKYGFPGDANSDTVVNVSDATYIINYAYGGGDPPPIPNRGDANADCKLNVSDAVYIINYAFGGGPLPQVGCVEIPWGGKINSPGDGPLDPEMYPTDQAESNEIQVYSVRNKDGSKTIMLNTMHNIHGLSLALRARNDSEVEVENLLQQNEAMDIYWSQKGNLIKIGFIDTTLTKYVVPGKKALVRISGDFKIERSLAAEITSDGTVASILPKVRNLMDSDTEIVFEQNYPNPFNPETRMSFSLPYEMHVNLEIYNILGQKVVTLANDFYSAGEHSLIWDGTDEDGRQLAAGIYFSRFQADDYVTSRKIVLLK